MKIKNHIFLAAILVSIGLVVTNATERTVELRALMSAVDASTAWDLRCHVREKLIEFVQKNYPEALPKLRAELYEQKVDE